MTKKILITGKNSYVGNQLADWLAKEPKQYEVVKESVRDGRWKDIDFSIFDVVVHVAGIAHQDTKANQEDLYYEVNTNLTIDIAKKAKLEGVKQFIFMSSMIVYGASSKIGETKVITRETKPDPINFYGNSKLLAEKGIQSLQSDDFNVVVIRPPMIYGRGSKGNYPILSKFAKLSPVFPNIENQRSMLHIDNLTEFIRLMIENKEKGLFFPQNREYVNTSEMVKLIANVNGENIKITKVFNPLIMIFRKKIKIFDKIFGTLVYDFNLTFYQDNYQIRNMSESIILTEKNVSLSEGGQKE
ncbi:NAD-dependent epimerase/dehydratase family protein [Desemzia sp. C1]|uniref:NAD-dependent epimerase/dehydratase family protein n=1 Tax=Desemzia sp. C1 TaxID=2892016 RepID=UPI001E641524|nr:NAD-dependent epimerase/dehydratase family protein [Desemzia sp. C1]MCI3028744.1 NAD-dependent epimerase/dehydratase family protein [Desemzia sp. C1]